MQHASASDLGRKTAAGEVALQNRPARAVIEHALLHQDRRALVANSRVHDDQLAADPAGLRQETSPLRLIKVAVEVTREDSIERAVFERQLQALRLDELGLRRLPSGDLEHRLALIEGDHFTGQVPG